MSGRHSWREPERFPFKSERECRNGCGVIKVTRHESGTHWVEYWRDCECISKRHAPRCEKVKVSA